MEKVKMYKLVSQNWETHGGMKWGIGETNRATKPGNEMCTDQVLHCYRSPYEAVLFNPIHANIQSPILLQIECSPLVNNDGLKYACKEQTPIKVVNPPELTTQQRAAVAIKMALFVYKAAGFVNWANDWLSGKDRSESAARYAARSARYAAEYAAWSAESAAESAAEYAARAAESAAWSAESAARYAARSARYAAEYAAWSAESARYAAEYAAWINQLQEVIEWVVYCFQE